MLKRISLLVLLLSFTDLQPSNSQSVLLDSLKRSVGNAKNDSLRIWAMGDLAQKYLETDLKKAQVYADSIALISGKSGIKHGEGLSHSLNGIIQLQYGNYENALNFQLKALKVRKSLNDRPGIIKSLNNIGNVYRELQQYEKAVSFHMEAVEMARIGNYSRDMANAMNNIGNANILSGKLETAIAWLDSSYTIMQMLQDTVSMAAITGNIGAVYFYKRDTLNALKYFTESLRLRYQLGDAYGVVSGEINLGQVYCDLGRLPAALQYFHSALEKATEMQLKERMQLCYLGLSDTYAKARQFEEAFRYNRLYVMYRDTLMNEDMNLKMSEMQAKFDSDIKDKEIRLLSSENLLRKSDLKKEKNLRYAFMSAAAGMGIFLIMGLITIKSRRRRREADFNHNLVKTEMRALRSQMNPHFIFNSLQSIQNFLTNHRNDEANEYLLKFSRLIRMVLENSMHQDISLREELNALELYMQLERLRLPIPFQYEFDISGEVDTDDTPVPPLILQPFVENAIWHGFQNKQGPGHLCIRVRKVEDSIHITIEDDGVGYSSSKTHDPVNRAHKRESLGMKLTAERLRIVNELRKAKAWFEVTDRPDSGTRVNITLPV